VLWVHKDFHTVHIFKHDKLHVASLVIPDRLFRGMAQSSGCLVYGLKIAVTDGSLPEETPMLPAAQAVIFRGWLRHDWTSCPSWGYALRGLGEIEAFGLGFQGGAEVNGGGQEGPPHTNLSGWLA